LAAGRLTEAAVARLQPESFASHDRNSNVAIALSPFLLSLDTAQKKPRRRQTGESSRIG
jgi:hypothetical protein